MDGTHWHTRFSHLANYGAGINILSFFIFFLHMMGTEHNKISSKYQQEYPFQSHKSPPSEQFFSQSTLAVFCLTAQLWFQLFNLPWLNQPFIFSEFFVSICWPLSFTHVPHTHAFLLKKRCMHVTKYSTTQLLEILCYLLPVGVFLYIIILLSERYKQPF